jgi:uncharacterized protein
MNIAASIIQTLHRIHRQKTDLEGQLARGPKAVAAAQAQLKHAMDHFQMVRDQLTHAKMEADSKQLQMLEREGKIHKWEGMLNVSKENREYQALKDQIAADAQANAVLSDEILELLERIDDTQEQLGKAEQQVAVQRENLATVEQRVASRREILKTELARVLGELSQEEQKLSGEFKREYERLIAAMGEDAMAELDDNCCSGCCKSLTPMLLDRLLMKMSVTCPSCGRIVYKGESA